MRQPQLCRIATSVLRRGSHATLVCVPHGSSSPRMWQAAGQRRLRGTHCSKLRSLLVLHQLLLFGLDVIAGGWRGRRRRTFAEVEEDAERRLAAVSTGTLKVLMKRKTYFALLF
jgi:hypothetical protein